ncbi:MAG TPA: NAD(P)H-dependent glycerol-3-phosphate dehydrogenase [Candidatus Krumholzibacteria bacterium]|nr:NAD(P)H-dependent glycerol-3-phosphate dehydrogenase [Candidatus Krumholzibacteria bacterium]
MRAAVLGAGSWGTTLAIVLAENRHDVSLWEFDAALATDLARTRQNSKFLPGIDIPSSIQVTNDLALALRSAELVVCVVPSHATRQTAKTVKATGALHPAALIVCATKGLEEGSLARMSEVLGSELEVAPARIVSLLGPSHAEEVSRRVPTSIVAAGADPAACAAVQEAFVRPYFRVYTNDDVVGVELATSLKNSIAIAAGILDGLGFGDNTKAALVTRGLAEITRLGVAMGAAPETFSGLAGVGDLVVTCLSRHSRNRHLGEAIGRGETLEQALSGMVMVAEGVRTTRAAVELGRRHRVELPIIEMVHRVLFDGHDPRAAVTELMMRPPRAESRGMISERARGGRE